MYFTLTFVALVTYSDGIQPVPVRDGSALAGADVAHALSARSTVVLGVRVQEPLATDNTVLQSPHNTFVVSGHP